MTPDDLRCAAEALYGPTRQASLACLSRDLNVSDVTVRRWIDGERPIDGGVQSDIVDLLAVHQCERIASVMASIPSYPREIVLSCYETDSDLREITGEGWSAAFHALMLDRIAELLREHGIIVRPAPVNAPAYFKWLGKRENTPAMRSEFAARLLSPAH